MKKRGLLVLGAVAAGLYMWQRHNSREAERALWAAATESAASGVGSFDTEATN